MKFYIVDAFAEELFGGNPAGVVILNEGTDFLTDEIMIKTAAELRYSETAFIRQVGEKEFNIRYFTPVEEVNLCGHATIGSFGALLDAGTIHKGQIYEPVSYTHLRAHETRHDLVCRLLLEKKKTKKKEAQILDA